VTPRRAPTWWRARPVLVDGALAVLLVLVFGMLYGPLETPEWLLAAQVLPLAFRRVAPIPVAGVVVAAHLVQVALIDHPLPSNVAVLVVVYTVAAQATARWQSWGVLGVGLAGAVIASLDWYLGPTRGSVSSGVIEVGFTVGTIGMSVLAAWVLGDVVRRRRLVVSQLREQNEALARDQEQRALLAAQRERASIAREMHDIVAHSLSVVVVQADGGAYAARSALDRADGPELGPGAGLEPLRHAAETLETVAATARAALTDTRRLVAVLRESGSTAEYAPQQGLAHLEEMVGRLVDSGVPVQLAVRGDLEDLSHEVDLAAYRVVQESLTNVLKHAGAGASAEVDVLRSPSVLLVRVSDSGRGPGDHDGRGNGIIGMTERVEVLGGTLYAGARSGGGFEVVASIPVGQDGTERTS
jgi:signal transduction histidine kinase